MSRSHLESHDPRYRIALGFNRRAMPPTFFAWVMELFAYPLETMRSASHLSRGKNRIQAFFWREWIFGVPFKRHAAFLHKSARILQRCEKQNTLH